MSAYLRLLRRCLTRDLFPDSRYEGDITKPIPYIAALRRDGRDWPTEAETMVGLLRLENLEQCCAIAIRQAIPGDFVETGIWRGGCGILMRAVLEEFNEKSRWIWLFDSFEGLPRPDEENYPQDRGDTHYALASYLGVSMDQVKANFARYELLDERVQFIKGWFRDTLPNSPVRQISVLRLDGDLYESTHLVLSNLYPKVARGGFVIVDDYGAIEACKQAVTDFRSEHNIQSPITSVDWTGVFWRK